MRSRLSRSRWTQASNPTNLSCIQQLHLRSKPLWSTSLTDQIFSPNGRLSSEGCRVSTAAYGAGHYAKHHRWITISRSKLRPGPFMTRPYRACPAAPRENGKQFDTMFKQDDTALAQCGWASSVVLTPKADGRRAFCIDCRRLNSITVRDTYVLPRVDVCLYSLRGADTYSTLSANSACWQISTVQKTKRKEVSLVSQDSTASSVCCLH